MSSAVLVVDVGNSRIHYGVFRGRRLIAHHEMHAPPTATADDLLAGLLPLLRADGIAPHALRALAAASVVPALTAAVTAMARRLGLRALAVDPADGRLRTGLSLRLPDPGGLGADRLVNAAAARERYGAPVIVADFGSATTFDVVSARSEFLGGVIAAGVDTLLQGPSRAAARLPRVDLARPSSAIGTDTLAALASGVYHTVRGQVREVVDSIRKEVGRDAPLVVTGGWSGRLGPELPGVRAVRPHLTLEGLSLIEEWNR